jgi:hypothetical protein
MVGNWQRTNRCCKYSIHVGFAWKLRGWAVTAEYIELTLPQRRALIRYVYCRPRTWERPRSELRAMCEYARPGLRMYPLADSP